MPSDSSSDPKLEIAHVLAIDLVGYSNLLINEQSRIIAELNRAVRDSVRFQQAEAENKLLRLPTGDGMVLVFFQDPEGPIECAMEISAAIESRGQIPLRMGIHSGPVNQIVDVNDRSNIAGAGIDIAQRVMDCGDAGHILLSKRVAEDLAPFPRWNPHLHDLGECEVKHGRKVSLVNFYTDTIGNPERPKRCAVPKEETAERSTAPPREIPWLKRTLTAVVAFLILALVIGDLFLSHRTRPRTEGKNVPATITAKSIAVLPFENLSRDPDNAYFADGIQEEILTRLSKIADLKVISRTSTQRYKSAPSNLLEIARQLGVAHILEGTVQKAADQVRVSVQLINAQNDSHVWADKYDRKLTDIFVVESEIATNIASALKSKLSGQEQQALTARPTESSEAHQLYLKGRYFWRKRTEDGFKNALNFFQQALAQDPNYALAYAGMADCYTLLANWRLASPAECYPKAKAAASKALEIDDSLGEAHASLGEVLSCGQLNQRDARREFERAIELNPNYATAHHWLGIDVLAVLGEFDDAIAELKHAVELDPFSQIINTELGLCYIVARRYPEAVAQLRRTVELDPGFTDAHRVLGEALVLSGQLDQAIGEYEKAYNISHEYSQLMRAAHAYALKGEREKALQLFNQAKELSKPPVWAYGCALVFVGLGNKEEAITWLEQSYLQKESVNISLIKVHPFLDPLRGDARFEKLANQIVPPDMMK